jgi:hypothetical protein
MTPVIETPIAVTKSPASQTRGLVQCLGFFLCSAASEGLAPPKGSGSTVGGRFSRNVQLFLFSGPQQPTVEPGFCLSCVNAQDSHPEADPECRHGCRWRPRQRLSTRLPLWERSQRKPVDGEAYATSANAATGYDGDADVHADSIVKLFVASGFPMRAALRGVVRLFLGGPIRSILRCCRCSSL